MASAGVRTLLLSSILALLALTATGQMTTHHINVGQADATLLELKGAAILIDAGGGETAGDPDRERLRQYLETFFKRRIDLKRTIYSFIVTHPHKDHAKYVMDVLAGYDGHPGFDVKNFVDNGDERTASGSKYVKDGRAFIEQKNAGGVIKAYYNKIDSEDIGSTGYMTPWLAALQKAPSSVEIRFFNASRNCENKNNDSLVVVVKYGKAKFLIGGDAEWDPKDESLCVPAIPRMLKKFAKTSLLNVDVYKTGHHGAENGTNVKFMKMMSPKISVISAGHYQDRDENGTFDPWHYGHPRQSAVDLLIANTSGSRTTSKKAYAMSAAGKSGGKPVPLIITKAVYCTCWDGDIRVRATLDGKTSVRTSK